MKIPEARLRDKKGKYIKTTPNGWRAKAAEYQKVYLASHRWARHRMYAQSRAKKKGWAFSLTTEECRILWHRDQAHLLREPSIDRINPKLGYSFSNCRFIERRENIRLGNLGRPASEKQREQARKNLSRWAHNRKTKV